MEKFKFTPENGWNDTQAFPNKQDEANNREMFNKLHFQTKDFINELIDQLESIEETSGASVIGSYAIEGLLNEDETEATTVKEQIEALKRLVDSNDTSINDELVITNTNVTELDTKVEDYNETIHTKVDTEVARLDGRIDTKANSVDVYTKEETNDLLDTKANASNVYTKQESEALVDSKADLTDVYERAYIDARVSQESGAIATINSLASAAGNVQLVGGTGITISVNSITKTITITATGQAVPGAHRTSHEFGGNDVIRGENIAYGEGTLDAVINGLTSDVSDLSSDVSSLTTNVSTVTNTVESIIDGTTTVPSATNSATLNGHSDTYFATAQSLTNLASEVDSKADITQSMTLSIPTTAWEAYNDIYRATITWSGITTSDKVDVNFDLDSLENASDVKPITETTNNAFYLYASAVPSETLSGVAYREKVFA